MYRQYLIRDSKADGCAPESLGGDLHAVNRRQEDPEEIAVLGSPEWDLSASDLIS